MSTSTVNEQAEPVEIPESDERLGHVSASLSAWQERAKAWGFSAEEIAAAAGVEGEAYAPHKAYDVERSCTGTLRILDKAGATWFVQCDVCRIEVGVNMATADPERLLEERLAEAGIPAMFLSTEFDKTEEAQAPTAQACREWIKGFRSGPVPAIGLWGSAGRGKSHLLSLMVETVIRRYRVRALYRSAVGLLDELTEGFDRGDYERNWRRVCEVAVLAVDDLGAQRMTDWRRERLAELVDARYRSQRPLLIATNIPPAGWADEFGERTASRLRGMLLAFRLEGPDRRDPAQQNLGV